MPDFIVEDGQGIAGAESYNTVEEFKTYVEKMGYEQTAVVSASDTRIQARLRRSAIYLDGMYGIRANGTKKHSDQGLVFPRVDAYFLNGDAINPDSVPSIYKAAHIEVAILSLQGTALAVTQEAGPRLKRDKTDALEEEYFEDSYINQPYFGWLDVMLANLFLPLPQDDQMRIGGLTRA